MGGFICSKCKTSFTRKNNLVRHIKRNSSCVFISSPIKKNKIEGEFICDKCGVNFTTKKHVARHVANGVCSVSKSKKKISKNKPNPKKNSNSNNYRILRFENIAEFFLWKDDEEQRTLSKYSQDTSAWTTKQRSKKIRYRCHRGGYIRLKDESLRKRHVKRKGSCKINNYCSAHILYEENLDDGKITVQYNPIHCNHSVEMKHLPLSSTDKENIAEKLKVGVPLDRVLDDIRDTLEDNQVTRTQLITKHELHNIMQEKKISYQERKSYYDPVSVELIIEEYRTNLGKDTPFKFYKEQGVQQEPFEKDDVLLVMMDKMQIALMKQFGCNKICVDSTHATNNYEYYLNTVLVVNDVDMGVPVAHAISNKENTVFIKKFFEVIKEECGVIQTNTFMSDDFPAYINAWTQVMGKPTHTLLCHWHVDKNWRKNLKLVNGSKELKDEIYKVVRTLMDEKDAASFPNIVISAVEKLKNDPNTAAFGKYFEREYSERYETWAFAFRKYIGMNTNMKIEAMHNLLKNVYLNGLKNKRVDKLINTLLKMNRNKAFERLSHLVMETDSHTHKKVRDRHVTGKTIPAEDVSIISFGVSGVGQVKSQSKSNQSSIYEITKISDECSCRLRCEDCNNICVHLFECTCDDYVFGYNICKHLHAYALKVQFLDECGPLAPVYEAAEVHNILEILQSQSPTEIKNDSLKKRDTIQDLAREIIQNVQRCSEIPFDEDDNKAISSLKQINKMLQLKVKGLQKKKMTKSPMNKKIDHQKRFYSTKKKRASGHHPSKPSTTEKAELKKLVLESKCDLINFNSSDHTYIPST
ncbi:uncharacterized protein LOC135847771 [Planococcus citri]|uniref:uncharacterized protein LOC135845939 n=1 Tax=Planococcus citri TaxID=170843 RepID=UPI0031F9C623